MKKFSSFIFTLCCLFLLSFPTISQSLPQRWDEITAADWNNALEKSNRTCILPFGVLEKHGPHVPMGSDLIRAREYALRATQQEYAVVFPDYFYGQLNETKHQPGVFALPSRVAWDLLEHTCEEIARNGFNKIIIVNGHGGNPDMIRYFIQTRLEKERDYAVYFFQPGNDTTYNRKLAEMRKSDPRTDQHAGERETAEMMYFRPDLVQIDSAKIESGARQGRLSLPNLYTGIWWYADYPNQYAGDGSVANAKLGKLIADNTINQFIQAIKTVKNDTQTLKLQKEFYDRMWK